jgi:cell shape-determining protein MreC
MSKFHSPRLAFRSAIALTVVVALLPWRGWTNDVSAIVSLPVMPLSDGANALLGWLRPTPVVIDNVPLDQIVQERDEAVQRLAATQLHVAVLENQIEQLQHVPPEILQMRAQLLNLRIAQRNPTSPVGPIELKGGEERGVPRDAIAVYNGVHLLGRVIQVDRFRSRMLPITNPDRSNLYIGARVARSGQLNESMAKAPLIQLTPVGDGTFSADVDRALELAVGDVVMLDDEAWPRSAQACTLGIIESVKRKDQEPLRDRVIVRPRYTANQVTFVTLIIEQEEQTVRAEP